MRIKSYLAYPQEGRKEELARSISNVEGCAVIPAKNRDVLIVITDSENQAADDRLRQRLECTESLKWLAMVSGFSGSERQSNV